MSLKTGGIVFIFVVGLGRSQSGTSRLEFEVASIKANNTGERLDYGIRGDRIHGENMPAIGWIQIAYEVKEFQIRGPGWISTERFDIEAEAENAVATGSQMRRMLRSLLADRFALKLHREIKESPAYALFIGRGGLKMKPSKDQTLWAGDFPDGSPDGRPVAAGGPTELAPGRFLGEAIPINMFIALLAGPLGRPVINKTGLKGRYDIDLRYAPGLGQASSGQVASNDPEQTVPAGISPPALFTAIQEQLGLTLQSTKAPVEIFVIDHVERPSEN